MANTIQMQIEPLTKEEIVRRGKDIYEQKIKAKVISAHKGELLSVDVLSGDYAVGDDPVVNALAVKSRHPDAILFGLRVGYKTAYVVGARMEEDS